MSHIHRFFSCMYSLCISAVCVVTSGLGGGCSIPESVKGILLYFCRLVKRQVSALSGACLALICALRPSAMKKYIHTHTCIYIQIQTDTYK